jgi:hypothetical protein
MLKKLDLGTIPGDKTGTSARAGGQIINDNFDFLDAKIEAVNNILVDAGYSLNSDALVMNSGWQWQINGVTYTNPEAVSFTIPYAASGNYRLDAIVMNTSNTFSKVTGAETTGNPVTPLTIANTIEAVVFNVSDSVVYNNKAGVPFLGVIQPTSTPSGSGPAVWRATEAGVYINFGGFEVLANSLAEFGRDANGVFSISQTAFVFSVNGVIESGNIEAVSGDTVFKNLNTITYGLVDSSFDIVKSGIVINSAVGGTLNCTVSRTVAWAYLNTNKFEFDTNGQVVLLLVAALENTALGFQLDISSNSGDLFRLNSNGTAVKLKTLPNVTVLSGDHITAEKNGTIIKIYNAATLIITYDYALDTYPEWASTKFGFSCSSNTVLNTVKSYDINNRISNLESDVSIIKSDISTIEAQIIELNNSSVSGVIELGNLNAVSGDTIFKEFNNTVYELINDSNNLTPFGVTINSVSNGTVSVTRTISGFPKIVTELKRFGFNTSNGSSLVVIAYGESTSISISMTNDADSCKIYRTDNAANTFQVIKTLNNVRVPLGSAIDIIKTTQNIKIYFGSSLVVDYNYATDNFAEYSNVKAIGVVFGGTSAITFGGVKLGTGGNKFSLIDDEIANINSNIGSGSIDIAESKSVSGSTVFSALNVVESGLISTNARIITNGITVSSVVSGQVDFTLSRNFAWMYIDTQNFSFKTTSLTGVLLIAASSTTALGIVVAPNNQSGKLFRFDNASGLVEIKTFGIKQVPVGNTVLATNDGTYVKVYSNGVLLINYQYGLDSFAELSNMVFGVIPNTGAVQITEVTAETGFSKLEDFESRVNALESATNVVLFPDINKLVLPKVIETYVGDVLQIFKENICSAFDSDVYNIEAFSDKKTGNVYSGKDFERYWQHAPTVEETFNVTFKMFDNKTREVVSQATTTIKVLNKTISPATNINVQFAGDSLTYYNRIPDEFARVMKSSNAQTTVVDPVNGNTIVKFAGKAKTNITLVGTQKVNFLGWTGSEFHEGYGGWTWANFIGSGSPYYFNGALNFQTYLTTNNISSIDVMYMGLAWNDIVTTMTSVNDTAPVIANAKVFLRALHTQLPNTKVYLWTENFPSDKGGFGAHPYGATPALDIQDAKLRLSNLFLAYQVLVDDAEFSPYIKLIGANAMFDSNNMTRFALSPRNTRITNTEARGTDEVHPSDGGFFQIADSMVRSFIYNHLL